MKVKLKTTLADANGCHAAGSIIDVEKKDAVDLLNGGFAEAVTESGEAIESATVVPAENASANPKISKGKKK